MKLCTRANKFVRKRNFDLWNPILHNKTIWWYNSSEGIGKLSGTHKCPHLSIILEGSQFCSFHRAHDTLRTNMAYRMATWWLSDMSYGHAMHWELRGQWKLLTCFLQKTVVLGQYRSFHQVEGYSYTSRGLYHIQHPVTKQKSFCYHTNDCTLSGTFLVANWHSLSICMNSCADNVNTKKHHHSIKRYITLDQMWRIEQVSNDGWNDKSQLCYFCFLVEDFCLSSTSWCTTVWWSLTRAFGIKISWLRPEWQSSHSTKAGSDEYLHGFSDYVSWR
jgi:hypothetical protein